jgi:hypothetical protein
VNDNVNGAVEDRIRAATRAGAVRAVRPLELPEPAERAPRRARWARHWATWMAPLAVAAAIAAIAVSLVIIRAIPNGSSRLPVSPPPASSGVPRYYMALPEADGFTRSATQAVVGDTFTGRRLATLHAPAGEEFVSVTAGADDQTFVLGTRSGPKKGSVIENDATRWYLVWLTSGAKVTATMRELPVRVPETVLATALSPDDTRLAVLSASGGLESPGTKPTPVSLRLRIYSAVTGAPLHEWSGTVPYQSVSFFPLVTWTGDGQQVTFDLNGSPRLEVRMLPADDPGHGLLTDSRLAWSVPEPSTYYPTREHPFTCGTWDAPDPLVTTDGKTVVCGASSIFAKSTVNPAGGQCGGLAWSSGGIVEYSAATGKPTRTLYRSESNCLPVSGMGPVAPLWASDSGDTVLGYFNFGNHIRFGVIRQGTFTPLPTPPALSGLSADLTAIAW